ncbi:MAG: hydantoin utilization protein [Candidatus Rokuibacteriota bacterium]|nr:MAG: hydantoin utilization protein [Candidatus Rokubacteria bacterium]
MTTAGVRVGVDVGGTFTDLVAWDGAGQMSTLKVPTTPDNPAGGVLAGLAAVARVAGPCASLAHGTTLVTNAIVERRVGVVGLVTTRGFRDVLEIGRMNRPHLYRLDLPAKPEPLVPRRLRAEVSERIGPDGSVLAALELAELPDIIRHFRSEGVESVAICLLHAYANPAHEQALRLALAPHFPFVSVSSEINAEFREYERTSTTVLNAAVMPLAARYLDDLVARLASGERAVPIHLLHSAGGMMSVEAARARPLTMAMSGPAAGVAAAAHLSRTLGLPRALAFDMGGTTTDVCLVADGVPETARQRKLGDYPVRLPAVAVESIGAGGGSVAWVETTGGLKVGPRSAGAAPGPACYGLGGHEPTVSDADLILGYLNPERIYGGSIRLDRARAEAALDPLRRRFGLSLLDAAHAVVEVANANMQRALRLVSVQRGYDLREFTLIAYGGAGPVHAGALARDAGISRIVVPAHSGAFSALGCLVSPLRYDAVQTSRMQRRPPLRRPELRARDRRGRGEPRRAADGVRAAPSPALRLRDRRERRVHQPPGDRAARPRRRHAAGPRQLESRVARRHAPRLLPRDRRHHDAALRARLAGDRPNDSRTSAGRGRVVDDARPSGPALPRGSARQSVDRGRRVNEVDP